MIDQWNKSNFGLKLDQSDYSSNLAHFCGGCYHRVKITLSDGLYNVSDGWFILRQLWSHWGHKHTYLTSHTHILGRDCHIIIATTSQLLSIVLQVCSVRLSLSHWLFYSLLLWFVVSYCSLSYVDSIACIIVYVFDHLLFKLIKFLDFVTGLSSQRQL